MLETSYASLEIPPEPGQPIAIDSSSNSVELAWNTTALVKKKRFCGFHAQICTLYQLKFVYNSFNIDLNVKANHNPKTKSHRNT